MEISKYDHFLWLFNVHFYSKISVQISFDVFLASHTNTWDQLLTKLFFISGGQGSGVFNDAYGASLSFVNSSGTGGASSPQILADAILPSNEEVVVMLDEECNNDCGYVRPGSVAYRKLSGYI